MPPDRIRRPEAAELGRRSVLDAGQRTLVEGDVAMRVDKGSNGDVTPPLGSAGLYEIYYNPRPKGDCTIPALLPVGN